ncbi:MAG: iron-sulfur cluster repair di-iron protein [Capsulimonas sp.]|uniref:iron-sulfur cluster repair di-iron protein n=1 Tax=Capsulimonas sp. TaxID=2494211 RepID=UPI003263F0D9
MNTISLETSVGQLVAERPARSRVFEHLGIDYCCGGRRSLDKACAEKGLDTKTVLEELTAVDAEADDTAERDWTAASMTELCDHIEAAHHDYVRQALPRLTDLIAKVNRAHGADDHRLVELSEVFGVLRPDFEAHLAKEELILFPLCREMDNAETPPKFHSGSLGNPIKVMLAEHDDSGEALSRIRQLTDDFAPPAGACNTYRAMLEALEAFEKNTHQHVHLENNILFVKAVAAENKLMASA